MAQKAIIAQTDFSGGQVNPSAKRRDDLPAVKTGARQMENWRIEAVGSIVPRPGRIALAPLLGSRCEFVRITPDAEYLFSFSAGRLDIYWTTAPEALTLVASNTGYPWTADTLGDIQWSQFNFDVVICYPGVRPQILHYNYNGGFWVASAFAYAVLENIVQEPFFSFVGGIRITPSAQTGVITLTASQGLFLDNMIGTRLSILGQQVLITAVADLTHATATVAYQLPSWIKCYVSSLAPFQPRQVVEATKNQFKFEVDQIGTDGTGMFVSGTAIHPALLDATAFIAIDTLVSPIGSASFTSAPVLTATPQATIEWQEEFMSDRRGWPKGVSYDRGRIIFYDFPQAPEAILWSAIGADTIFWVDEAAATNNPAAGTLATSAILEFIPGKPRVRHVIGWAEQFVFTDRGIFYIPVSGQNPLIPGSVEFRQLSNDGVSGIRPIPTQTAIVFINAGLTRVSVVRATGSLTRPYISEDESEAYQPLFKSPVAMSVATGDGAAPERYIYIVNADGSLAVGKFTSKQETAGWVPWTSAGLARWVTTAGPSVWFTVQYGSSFVLELEDFSTWFDGMVAVNAPIASMAVAGKGPLWHLASMPVVVMDRVTLFDFGDRMVDGNGNLILSAPTDDFSAATVIAGLFAPPVLEPYVPSTPSGPDRGQRQKRRRAPRVGIVVQDSSGFSLGNETIPPTNWGENPLAGPVLRETTYRRRFLSPNGVGGRDYDFDPAIVLVKDRPGRLRIVEVSFQVDL